jgi:hypothetical protein
MSDTPRTDKHQEQMEVEDLDVECSETYHLARDLERELAASQAKISTVFQWINRNHSDGFIDSLTHLQNLERVSDVQHDRLDRLERELATAEAELSISNGERDHYRRENAEMREAINGVSKILQSIQLNDIFEDTMRNHAILALAKLKPFLK